MLAIGCIAWAATYAWQTPGLQQALLAVGDDMQLPLERLATDAGDATAIREATAQPASSSRDRRHTAAHVRDQAQAVLDALPAASARKHRLARGYEHTITDSKYWT
ncbi:hypothetical protein C0Z17_22810 [Trinickia caryophylli]|nr:hypothetical protein C0Z17_22810 [Trinickia caryophylli]